MQGRGVEGVDEPVTLSGGDYCGHTALSSLGSGPPPLSPENAASLSFCDVFVLTRRAATNLLGTLRPDLRSEWLSLTSRHADGVEQSDEENNAGAARAGAEIEQERIGSQSLNAKMKQLREIEFEADKLRNEIAAMIDSSALLRDR